VKVASLRTRRLMNNSAIVCAALVVVCSALMFVVFDRYVAGCAGLTYAVVMLIINTELRVPKGPAS
jgi:hypothetical protein